MIKIRHNFHFGIKFFQTKEDIRRVIRDTCESKIVRLKTWRGFNLKQKIFELSLAGKQFYELGKAKFTKKNMETDACLCLFS